MLSLNKVSRDFGGVQAVDAVSLDIEPGIVHGLIGPNGAGKTTLLNLVSGLLRLSTGSITLDGTAIDHLEAHDRARKGIARTFQNLRVYQNLTVQQNIDVAAGSRRKTSNQAHSRLVQEAIQRFDLADKLSLLSSVLSYGHMRRLEIVRALALAPKVLMLDEPAAGMNQQETTDLIGGLEWIRDNYDCSILVIDHDLRFIMSVCNRITVMSMGAVLMTGSPSEVSTDPRVVAAYLGESAVANDTVNISH